MLIGRFDTTTRPLLIAEIGNNHEGDPVRAAELVDAAVAAGADAVKVQIIDPPRLVNRSQTARIAQLGRYALGRDVFMELAARTRRGGALFMASVFDCESLSAWAPDLDAIKIASGDLDLDPMLAIAAGSGRPTILSTGMATLPEILRAVDVHEAALPAGRAAADALALLHCTSLYPTPWEAANLRAIPMLAAATGLVTGYSDHTLGTEAVAVALALGARVIEKHFTLDKAQSDFRDHALSADPPEFARIAQLVRGFEDMAGTGRRALPLPDAATRAAARRSIVARRDLVAGAVLTMDDLDYVRPEGGLPPGQAAALVGRRLRRAVAMHDLLSLGHVD